MRLPVSALWQRAGSQACEAERNMQNNEQVHSMMLCFLLVEDSIFFDRNRVQRYQQAELLGCKKPLGWRRCGSDAED